MSTTLAAIHVAKKQLGLDDDTYRAVLVRVTGKESAREMSEIERQRVVEALRKRGFKKASKPSRNKAAGPYRGKLQALWIAMWNLGLAADGTDAGLTAFVRRQTRVDHTRFLIHHDDATAVIEALKDWMAREAGVDWRHDRFLPAWTQVPGYRIAHAQFFLLKKLDPAFADYVELDHWVAHNVDIDFRAWGATDAEWIVIMNRLGEAVREARRQSDA